MPARSSRKAAALLALGIALAAAGCGSSSRSGQSDVRLQREDLIATARALTKAQPEAASEVAAAKAAWPVVAHGLPRAAAGALRPVATAARAAGALKVPSLFGRQRAAGLTGPGAGLAGTYRNFVGLSGTGWAMLEHALGASAAGGPAGTFARANSPLYISSVYDGHFGLSQIGEKLQAGYSKLGGAAAFGRALTPAEVAKLAAAYSEQAVRLNPHPSVKLGS